MIASLASRWHVLVPMTMDFHQLAYLHGLVRKEYLTEVEERKKAQANAARMSRHK